jgi:hypothetical protein
MTIFQRDKIYIPEAWTGEQALAVWEFLEEIGSAIWDVHEKGILKAMNIKESMLIRAARGDDDFDDDDEDYIPF